MRDKNLLTYAIISLGAFVSTLALVVLYIYFLKDLNDLRSTTRIYYILLIPIGLSASSFLFGILKSYAIYSGKDERGSLNLRGPVVLFMLVILVGLFFAPQDEYTNFNYTFSIADSTGRMVLNSKAQVVLLLPNDSKIETIDGNGRVYFKGIPIDFKDDTIEVKLVSDNYTFFNNKNSDERVFKRSGVDKLTVKLKEACLKVSGRVITGKEKKENVFIKIQGIVNSKTGLDKLGNFNIVIPSQYSSEKYTIVVYSTKTNNSHNYNIYPCQDNDLTISL